MKTEKFVYRYMTPDGSKGPASDDGIALVALNAFVTRLKLDGRTHEADKNLWTGKTLKQEQTGKNAYRATIIFTKK